MRRFLIGYLLGVCCLLMCSPQELMARRRKQVFAVGCKVPDSVIDSLIGRAALYSRSVAAYEADLYVKSRLHLLKRNFLFNLLPSSFAVRKDLNDYLFESVNRVHYTAPSIFDVKVRAVSSTSDRYVGLDAVAREYFHVNVYSASVLREKILSPLAGNAPRYYHYIADSVGLLADSGKCMRICFYPRMKSEQLVAGQMLVEKNGWRVRSMVIEGKIDFTRFCLAVEMGQEPGEMLLPKRIDLNLDFRFLGNRIDAECLALLDYDRIEPVDTVPRGRKRPHGGYDLSRSFTLTCDSTSFFSDSLRFSALRPLPLTSADDSLYRSYGMYRHSLKQVPKKKSAVFWGQVGDIFLSSHTLEMARFGNIKSSPLVNPLLVSYSASNGFSYRQEFKYNCLFPDERLLRVVPKIGYNFTRKEFYWSVEGDFHYLPQKRASIRLEVGNGNRIYSSDVLDEIKAIPDSTFDFDLLHLDYFKDLYALIEHNIEVCNGLELGVGLTMHRRTPAQKPRLIVPPGTELPDEMLGKVRRKYVSFAPHLRVSWTPGMYYYRNGKRKMNLGSHYPTFVFDWERGIRGVLGSTGEYERFELDIQHKVRLGLMRSLCYRLGAGMFTNQKETYFVDFAHFTRSNLPMGWNDDIGGLFQLLDGRWYNSSDRFVRAHLTYETPFLLIPHAWKHTGLICNERIYFNLLFVPRLVPYVELGYGIGTHIFDLGVFVNSVRGQFDGIGCKFTFELFN